MRRPGECPAAALQRTADPAQRHRAQPPSCERPV